MKEGNRAPAHGQARYQIHKQLRLATTCSMSKRQHNIYPEAGPAWDRSWHHGLAAHQHPRDMGGYEVSGESAYDGYWQSWLEEMNMPPPANES